MVEKIWDSHFHLSENEKTIPEGINGILCTLRPSEYLSLGKLREGIYPFLGLHPWWADYSLLQEIKNIILHKDRKRIYGLGEIGLDRRRGPDIEIQRKVLETLLSIAVEMNLPVNIHCVRAFSDLLSIVKEFPVSRIVIHSFSGSLFYLEKFLEMDNCFISLSPYLLNHVDRLSEILRLLPLDRVLIETDFPYQTKRIEAWWDLLELVSQIKGCSVGSLLEKVKENLLNVVGRDGYPVQNSSFTKGTGKEVPGG